ncbi:MAG: D-glycero-beta-D-manno-heptose 1-phosphate adenylyltransferase [Chitinophagaceae bacterium]|nr:D-glycero-beta-D-manno-heptose 1-phosphate adenylyltransferase [Chitinophagaceae bacterium]MCW5928471.1 D-glycero-beta-D-manno-heptose 1-phosphate adenylyltransferase [Chitinophagaceae bacterium]
MKYTDTVQRKLLSPDDLKRQVKRWKLLQKKIVFTNGCFDILHNGHLEILSKAAESGDILIVGVNSDRSVRKLKGDSRPVNNEQFRATMLASMIIVDGVTVFEEETPLNLIQEIEPDVLVKGGDYSIEQIVGAEEVIKSGGEVKVVPYVKGFSTTSLIAKIQSL